MKTDLGNNWERHSLGVDVPTDAYLTCHGSWQSSNEWTATPSSMVFYTLHGDSIYTVEIQQVLEQPKRLRIDDDIFNVSARSATSISGPNTLVWNYHFTCWSIPDYTQVTKWWKDGPLTADLLTLKPSNESTFSFFYDGRATSTLAELFSTLVSQNIRYERVHFLVCRAVEGGRIRGKPKNTKELYQQKTPYW